MDKSEDIKAPSAQPETAGDPAATSPAGPAAASEPAIESKSELAHIDSPTIAPVAIGAAAEAPTRDAEQSERAKETAEKFERIEPESPRAAAPASRDIIPLTAPAAGHASRTFSKFTLAASVVLASALGAMAGVLGASGMARLAPLFGSETASTPEPSSLQTTIAQLRSDIAALKASVDTTSRTTGTQYSKLVERLDRAERAQSVAPKTDAALPKETTGSITTPSPAATPLPPAPVPSAATAPGTIAPGTTVPGWAVRDVYRGVAMLQSRMGGMVEVEPGDVLPGLGRIESIRRQDGRWVVITSKGLITSMR
jgi:hypothetical protein